MEEWIATSIEVIKDPSSNSCRIQYIHLGKVHRSSPTGQTGSYNIVWRLLDENENSDFKQPGVGWAPSGYFVWKTPLLLLCLYDHKVFDVAHIGNTCTILSLLLIILRLIQVILLLIIIISYEEIQKM